ncbi:MAG: 6,7-dimethyl-8-ribityllumazine synthase [Hyphomicrobium sp.]
MVTRARETLDAPQPTAGHRLLLIEARYYAAISDALAEGALAELAVRGCTFERVVVPGALEIPQALAQAVAAGRMSTAKCRGHFAGAVALGCVIRGETSHYDIVCNNANHWLMELAMRHAIPVGNAILTVDTEAQAMARAEGGREGKGGDAVRACLALIDAGRAFEGMIR